MNAFFAGTHSNVYPNAPAGSFYYGDSGVPRAFTKGAVWRFSPRIGAMWDVAGNRKTVIHVGALLVADMVDLFMGQNMNVNPPFSESIENISVNSPTVVASSHFSLSGWPAKVINHWQIAPLVQAMSGASFTVLTGVDNPLTDTLNDRPNLTNTSVVYTQKKILAGDASNASYINAAAFTPNPIGTFGNAGRDAFRGPKFLRVDTALSRDFPLHEAFTLDLRLEAFNVLNHPNFSTPESNGYIGQTTPLTSPTSGDITATTNNYGARIFQGAI